MCVMSQNFWLFNLRINTNQLLLIHAFKIELFNFYRTQQDPTFITIFFEQKGTFSQENLIWIFGFKVI